MQTFDALYDAGKQIVMTSDRLPKDIPDLESRLLSRLEWGLIVDICQPDFETCIAILRKKAQEENMNISDEVIDFIAKKVSGNTRKLEAALIKLVGFSNLIKNEISIPLARELLEDIITD